MGSGASNQPRPSSDPITPSDTDTTRTRAAAPRRSRAPSHDCVAPGTSDLQKQPSHMSKDELLDLVKCYQKKLPNLRGTVVADGGPPDKALDNIEASTSDITPVNGTSVMTNSTPPSVVPEQIIAAETVHAARDKDHAYSVQTLRVVICANTDFEKAKDSNPLVELPHRAGSESDCMGIAKEFRSLTSEVCIAKDKTAEQMKELFREEAQHDNKNTDCLLVCILSHGCDDGVYGVDGKVFNCEQLYDMFDSHAAPTLKEKPKIFLIQACRGTKLMKGSTKREYDGPPTDSTPTQPSKTDFMFIFPTTQGHVSMLHTTEGSWFIQDFLRAFREHRSTLDLQHITTRCANYLAARTVEQGGTLNGGKEALEVVSTFTKDLYFPSV